MAPFKVKAVYEYSSGHEDDLKFGLGQIITITDEDDADWYGGEYQDENGTKHEGIFPRNFVEKYEPTAPPRPTRARTRRETDTAPVPPDAVPTTAGRDDAVDWNQASAPAPDLESEGSNHRAAQAQSSAGAAAPTTLPNATLAMTTKAAAEIPLPSPSAISSPPPSTALGREGSISLQSRGAPPPVTEKPSSFKDRIAAFNKAAPPPAPYKPSGLSASSGSANFVKKPFVAPPPSRNSYVPPQREAPVAKVYRRDEDPEVKEMEAEAMENAERAGLVPSKSTEGDDGDQPKPTSLKERIALLQKQQLEASQRQAELAAKKERAKKPATSRRSMSQDRGDAATVQAEDLPPLPQAPEMRADNESTGRRSVDEPRPTSSQHHGSHRRGVSRSGPSDVGGDAQETEGLGFGPPDALEQVTEREETVESPPAGPTSTTTVLANVPVDNEAEMGDQSEGGDEQEEEKEEEEEEEEEEEVDPEVRRKEELRARMAKMSGGMGMPGMFGMVPMATPPPLPKKKKSIALTTSASPDYESEMPPRGAPPVPMMALPGMSAKPMDDSAREDMTPTPVASTPSAPRPPSRGTTLSGPDESGRKTPEG